MNYNKKFNNYENDDKTGFAPHDGEEGAPSWIEITSSRENSREQNGQIGKAALESETTAERLQALKEKAGKVLRPVARAAIIIAIAGAAIYLNGEEQPHPAPKDEKEFVSVIEKTIPEAADFDCIYSEDGGTEFSFNNGAMGEDFTYYNMTCGEDNYYIVHGKATKSGGGTAEYEAEEGHGLDPSVVKTILDADLDGME